MLITSISGIRGTIGGKPGESLTPLDVVSFVSAYGQWVLEYYESPTLVVGRDARPSGSMILSLVVQTLVGMGIHVVNVDMATTPTVEMEVIRRKAQGAIIVTASHNPKEYNGLKMLDDKGEFLSAEQGSYILKLSTDKTYTFTDVDSMGSITLSYNHTRDHIQDILDLDLVDVDLIQSKKFTVAVDAINSIGGVAVPMLLEKLGVQVVGLYCEPHGDFQHMPEPLEQNLGELKSLIGKVSADLGIAVDPDVDRLVLVDEQGNMFGEEYTIVSIADYVIGNTPGNTVSNLSSSRALSDVAETHGVNYYASAVGEKNVVEKMKAVSAVIGGEGSGGVIYPPLHYGRDALVGIALFLSHLATSHIPASELKKRYTVYYMAKEKIILESRDYVPMILNSLQEKYADQKIDTNDGLKIDFADSWVQIRASNTEPILRIYTEAKTQKHADDLAQECIHYIHNFLQS
jgi:phosphomannomutase